MSAQVQLTLVDETVRVGHQVYSLARSDNGELWYSRTGLDGEWFHYERMATSHQTKLAQRGYQMVDAAFVAMLAERLKEKRQIQEKIDQLKRDTVVPHHLVEEGPGGYVSHH